MATKAKLVVSVVGLVAIAATPAMAKTHHVHHACRSHTPSDRPFGTLQIVTEVPDNWIMNRSF
jgi:hypothetical protein